ncbi:MAG: S-layer homology domain-containing protein [Selenomonadaceae bacterium]|jgi:hypothetical protein|nr:S-layer homology domain-containing protein [Selenomonadaceae bacterium]
MKKSVVSALTTALVVGATATTFAAANPFSDVPAGHWAYNSVTKLAAEGIIEGYGDGTFLGNRNITRYEMAQMIAKALAKNPQGATKAELDKLAAEFREELDNLGVRVSELEKHADMVQWTGKIEYTYNHHKLRGTRDMGGYKARETNHSGVFRLEPKAEINDHWTAVARLDLGYDGRNDSTGYAKLKRVYAEGNYDKFNVKVGRFGFCPDYEDGLVVDTVLSGINLNFGSKWKVDINAGRVGADSDEAHFGPWGAAGKHYYRDALGELIYGGVGDPTDIVRIGVQYKDNGERGLYGGVGYTWAKDKDFAIISKDGNGDKAQVYSAVLGYRFNDKFKMWASAGRNSKATSDTQKTSWQFEARYGNYGDYANKGDWAVWAGYSKFSEATAIATDQGDDIATGEKGWHIGVAYAPFKNTGILLRYADGKGIDDNVKDRHFWGRVEFFF